MTLNFAVSGYSTWLNEGAEYTSVNIWVGQLSLTATTQQQTYVSALFLVVEIPIIASISNDGVVTYMYAVITA